MSLAPPLASIRVTLAFLLALALTSLPFAHRTSAAVVEDPTFIAFVAAGGTLADLCSGPGHHFIAGTDCEACTVIGAANLASPPQGLIAPDIFRRHPHNWFEPLRLARSPATARPPVRGPPPF